MEQRQAVGQRIGLAEVLQNGAAEPGRNLVAVGVDHELGQAGGAAGVEIGRDILPAARRAECECAAVLGLERGRKPDHALRQRRIRNRDLHQLEVGQQVADGDGLVPDVELRMRPQRHQNGRTGRADEIGDVLRLQQEIDRHRVARGLRAPQREMGLDQARQDVGDTGRRPADSAEQVGGTGDAVEQLPVGHQTRRLVISAGHQHGQCGAIGKPRSALAEDVVDAGGVKPLRQRLLGLETDDVGQRCDRILVERRHAIPHPLRDAILSDDSCAVYARISVRRAA